MGSPIKNYDLITLVESYDLSKGNKGFYYKFPAHSSWSLQAIWYGVVGVPAINGQVQIQYSNSVDQPITGTSWDDHQTLIGDIDSNQDSVTLSSTVPFTAEHFNALIKVNGITAGNVKLVLKINRQFSQ